MVLLSVIIITKNEAKNLHDCLESVKFANEIIILDCGSSDETIKIGLQYTDQIYSVDWPGFGPQKNRALAKCHGEWVLSLDADERITEPLAKEIVEIISSDSKHDAYALLRKSTYCNKFIAHGDWHKDYCTRLFKRGTAHFTDSPIHERLIVTGKTGRLKGNLLHHSFSDLEEVINKVNAYSTLSAKHKFDLGKKSSLIKAITHGLWTFFRGYFLKGGFLDGKKGFMLAVSNAEGCYYRYLKMMLLQERLNPPVQ